MNKGQTFAATDISPQGPFWVIGDVHGRYDLLAPLLEGLLASSEPIVLLGDYINRGPDTAKVLKRLHQLTQSGQVIALRGNHEEVLRKFLVKPRVMINQFLRYGGGATLRSFGIDDLDPPTAAQDALRLRNALLVRMGPLADWATSRPYLYQSGNVAVMHAGADPAQPFSMQHRPSLCWGHPQFLKHPRQDLQWVICGHRPTNLVAVKDRRVSLNTLEGNGQTLSAVRVSKGNLDVL